jgi:hypothetical protein
MFLLPDLNARIARALTTIAHGEALAEGCARRQSALTVDRAWRAFLAEQARQEAHHAAFFTAGAKLFGGAPAVDRVVTRYERYRVRLETGLERGDWYDSLVGMQLVFEALGGAVLEAFERSPSPKVGLFAGLRRRIAREEDVHHAFGVRLLARSKTDAPAIAAIERAQEYRALGRELLDACIPLFADLGADCSDCVASFERRVAQALLDIKRVDGAAALRIA